MKIIMIIGACLLGLGLLASAIFLPFAYLRNKAKDTYERVRTDFVSGGYEQFFGTIREVDPDYLHGWEFRQSGARVYGHMNLNVKTERYLGTVYAEWEQDSAGRYRIHTLADTNGALIFSDDARYHGQLYLGPPRTEDED